VLLVLVLVLLVLLLLLLLLLSQKMQAAHDDLAQPVALWLFHCDQLFNWDAGKL
jgi:hypothetical protein